MGGFTSKPAEPSLIAIPTPVSSEKESGWGRTAISVLGGLFLLYVAYLFFNYIQKWNGLPGIANPFGRKDSGSGDKTPAPVDGKTRTVIPSGDVPSTGGADWGLQYWMYISDWNYKFGSDKDVVKRVAPNSPAIMSPRIFLSPSENTLNIRISIFPVDGTAGAAEPSSSSSTGDSFTCSVENVPLQSWFALSVTCFQRNLDIYINGRLVKSCVLPGVPKPAMGDIIIGDNGGFSGSVCNLNWYNAMLSPTDAKDFHSKGTRCAPPAKAGAAVDKDSVFITLFGYTFRFSKISKDGKELSSYTF